MANAETRTAALLLSFSAVLFLFLASAVLLQPPRLRGPLADLLLSALDRFCDGRSLLQLINRRNMILLCHAILFVILKDAGILSTHARRRAAVATARAEGASSTRARPHARSVVVSRRPRNRAAPMHDTARLIVPRRPRPLTGPEQVEEPVTAQEIVLVEKPRTHPGHHHRPDAIEQAAGTADGNNTSCGLEAMGGVIFSYDDETSRGEGEAEESVDELNKRFDRFIADMKLKMQLESQQLPLKSVSAGKEIVLA